MKIPACPPRRLRQHRRRRGNHCYQLLRPLGQPRQCQHPKLLVEPLTYVTYQKLTVAEQHVGQLAFETSHQTTVGERRLVAVSHGYESRASLGSPPAPARATQPPRLPLAPLGSRIDQNCHCALTPLEASKCASSPGWRPLAPPALPLVACAVRKKLLAAAGRISGPRPQPPTAAKREAAAHQPNEPVTSFARTRCLVVINFDLRVQLPAHCHCCHSRVDLSARAPPRASASLATHLAASPSSSWRRQHSMHRCKR